MLATSVAAQGGTVDPATVRGCTTEACVGDAANACMTATEGGETTVGMNGCLDAEGAVWDAILNEEYARLRTEAEAVPPGPGDYRLADGLRDMQRAWIAFRDAACGFRAAIYRGGTIMSTVTYDCLLRETARQAMSLRETEIAR